MKRSLSTGTSTSKRATSDIRTYMDRSFLTERSGKGADSVEVAIDTELSARHNRQHEEKVDLSISDDRVWVATPLLGLMDYNVPADQSFQALLKEVQNFDLTRYHVGICLVEDSTSAIWQDEAMLQELRAAQSMHDWFTFRQGDITQPLTWQEGSFIRPLCIVNPCNKRFSEKGGLVNTRIHASVGPSLKAAAQQAYDMAIVAQCYTVDVPPSTELWQNGVQHVMMILCPNANPSRPDCLPVDEACRLTSQCYRNMLIQMKTFTDSLQMPQRYNYALEQPALDVSARSMGDGDSFSSYNHPGPASRSSSSEWKYVLYAYTRATNAAKSSNIYYEDDHCVCIYDGFPKAKIHLLMMAKESFLDLKCWSEISTQSQITRFKELVTKANAIAQVLSSRYKGIHNFESILVGVHAIPSLSPIHIHIISDDFDSVFMKSKKHWNSFTTEFLIPVNLLLEHLESNDMRMFRSTERFTKMLKADMRCYRCGQIFTTIPSLKSHLHHCAVLSR